VAGAPHPHEVNLCLRDPAGEIGKLGMLRAAAPDAGADRARELSTCSVSSGSSATATLRPWRTALRATRALPAAVRGPVLERALRRLAARWRSVVTRAPRRFGGGRVLRPGFRVPRSVLGQSMMRLSRIASCSHLIDFGA
jgi:hypothetical protein